jgi:hypothetical protein
MDEILELSFEINTRRGIGINLPVEWWDSDENNYSVIERESGQVTINVKAHKVVILKWLFNLGKDGRYVIYPHKGGK